MGKLLSHGLIINSGRTSLLICVNFFTKSWERRLHLLFWNTHHLRCSGITIKFLHLKVIHSKERWRNMFRSICFKFFPILLTYNWTLKNHEEVWIYFFCFLGRSKGNLNYDLVDLLHDFKKLKIRFKNLNIEIQENFSK